jgi:redox-sensitive bicupin YhaK (pirin superfamily)
VRSPIAPLTPLTLLDLEVLPGGTLEIPADREFTAFAFITKGSIEVGSANLASPGIIMFADDGDSVQIKSVEGASLLWFCGPALREPVAFGGPFVMNTPEQITDAKRRFARGEMGHLDPSF